MKLSVFHYEFDFWEQLAFFFIIIINLPFFYHVFLSSEFSFFFFNLPFFIFLPFLS